MISTAISIYRSGLEQDLDELLDFFESRLKSELHDFNVEAIDGRKKKAESIQQKLQEGKIATTTDLKDLAGLTVVLLYRREIPEAIAHLKSSDLLIDDPGPIEVEPFNFRYHEPKLFIKPPQSYLERHPRLGVQMCEVQFTTALQHALDKATHDFDYKGTSYSWSNFRLVAQMRGILEMVDRTIDGIEEVALDKDATAGIPRKMELASEILPILTKHFRDRMPPDRRRFAETTLSWCDSMDIEPASLEAALSANADLVGASSIDPTSATLGVLLRVNAESLIANYSGHFLVTTELSTLCEETTQIPADRRVRVTPID